MSYKQTRKLWGGMENKRDQGQASGIFLPAAGVEPRDGSPGKGPHALSAAAQRHRAPGTGTGGARSSCSGPAGKHGTAGRETSCNQWATSAKCFTGNSTFSTIPMLWTVYGKVWFIHVLSGVSAELTSLSFVLKIKQQKIHYSCWSRSPRYYFPIVLYWRT